MRAARRRLAKDSFSDQVGVITLASANRLLAYAIKH
jgi:hypothetical protein